MLNNTHLDLRIKRFVVLAILFCVVFSSAPTGAGAGVASAPGVANFPASYQPALNSLKAKYPNWQFVALNTNLDWNTVIKNQTPPYPNNRSLVPVSFEPAMKDTSYTAQIEPGWVRASEGAVKYYMDPRNWLDEKSVFQFELLSYNSSVHTLSGVQSIVAGTFMATYPDRIVYTNTSNGSATIMKSYSQAILDAGVANKVSPYYLAAKIRQEVVLGGGGPSDSVTGKVPGYIGIYNFYNIGASAGANPVLNGLAWAKNSANGNGTPWTDPVKSITGGAGWIAKGYINVGQDTVYLQKYNVSPSDPSQLYWHQYMTNVAGAVSEGQKLYSGYSAIGALAQPKMFYIPVYNNMPSSPCYRPSGFPENDPNLYYVNTSGVNIRQGPGTSYASYGTFPEGTTVRVRKLNHTTANGYTWAEIELVDGRIGYIANTFLTKRAASSPPSIPTTPYVVTVESINVRFAPRTSDPVVAVLKRGETVKVRIPNHSTANGYIWAEIELADGRIGYVVANYIAKPMTTTPYVVIMDSINVRFAPRTSDPVVAVLKRGETVKVRIPNHSTANGYTWAEIELADGRIGYVVANYIAPSVKPTTSPSSLPIEASGFTQTESNDRAVNEVLAE